MTALSLFDLLQCQAGAAPDRGDADQRLADVAQRLDASSLSEDEHNDAMDVTLAPAPGRPFDRNVAVLLRGRYEQWAASAASLLDRVRQVERPERAVPGAEHLRKAEGRVAAMLSVSLTDLDQADEEIRRGQTISGEEVRREFQARMDAQRSAGPARA